MWQRNDPGPMPVTDDDLDSILACQGTIRACFSDQTRRCPSAVRLFTFDVPRLLYVGEPQGLPPWCHPLAHPQFTSSSSSVSIWFLWRDCCSSTAWGSRPQTCKGMQSKRACHFLTIDFSVFIVNTSCEFHQSSHPEYLISFTDTLSCSPLFNRKFHSGTPVMQRLTQRRPSVAQPKSPNSCPGTNPPSSFPLHFLTDNRSGPASRSRKLSSRPPEARRSSSGRIAPTSVANFSTSDCTPPTHRRGLPSEMRKEVADLRRQLAELEPSASQVLEASSSSPFTLDDPALTTLVRQIADLERLGPRYAGNTSVLLSQAKSDIEHLKQTRAEQRSHMKPLVEAQAREISRYKHKAADRIKANVKRLAEENSRLKKQLGESERNPRSENRQLNRGISQTEVNLQVIVLGSAPRADGTRNRITGMERDIAIMRVHHLSEVALLERRLEEERNENARLMQILEPPPYCPDPNDDGRDVDANIDQPLST